MLHAIGHFFGWAWTNALDASNFVFSFWINYFKAGLANILIVLIVLAVVVGLLVWQLSDGNILGMVITIAVAGSVLYPLILIFVGIIVVCVGGVLFLIWGGFHAMEDDPVPHDPVSEAHRVIEEDERRKMAAAYEEEQKKKNK